MSISYSIPSFPTASLLPFSSLSFFLSFIHLFRRHEDTVRETDGQKDGEKSFSPWFTA